MTLMILVLDKIGNSNIQNGKTDLLNIALNSKITVTDLKQA